MSIFRKYTRIDFLFAETGLLILLLGLFSNYNLDIAIHDTYIVIANFHISIILFLIFSFFAVIYYVLIKTERRLVKGLNLIHYFLTLLPILTAFFTSFIQFKPHRYLANEGMSAEMESMGKLNIIISITVLIALIGQILFIINILIALFRKKANQ